MVTPVDDVRALVELVSAHPRIARLKVGDVEIEAAAWIPVPKADDADAGDPMAGIPGPYDGAPTIARTLRVG